MKNRLISGFVVAGIVTLSSIALSATSAFAGHLPEAHPADVGMSEARLHAIDGLMSDAITGGVIPGGVVLVGRLGKIAYSKAYGFNSGNVASPSHVPVTLETHYDLASLTKVIATAPSILALAESRAIPLSDRYVAHWPTSGMSFAIPDQGITFEQLLRHRAGLPADNALAEYDGAPNEIWSRVFSTPLLAGHSPGQSFLYSDVSFLRLGRLVEEISGETLDRFAHDAVFAPTGMDSTYFLKEGRDCAGCAPTAEGDSDAKQLVHDPRSRKLGGVAGHAGLVSTAPDLANYAQMMLDCGTFEGRSVLRRATVRAMTDPSVGLPAGQVRGLGWDIDTGFSSPRGEKFPVGSFGHTGYTGTSVWIDPSSRAFVIILTNRVERGDADSSRSRMVKLRRSIATAAAGAIVSAPMPSSKGLVGFCAGTGQASR